MIIKLMYHDIISYGRVILIFFTLNMAWSSFLTMVDDPTWWLYIIIGSGQIATIVVLYLINGKRTRSEILLCSLPVKRSTLVLAKYSMCGIVILFGFTIWLLNAIVLHACLAGAPADLYLFQQPLLLVVILLFYTLYLSLILPITFRISRLWASILVMVISMSLFIIVFGDARQSLLDLQVRLNASTISALAFILILTAILFYLSIKFSIKSFFKRDL